MKNKTILSITIFAISLLIIPQMTFASWWKPNTWKIFNRKAEVKIEQKIIATSTPNNVISQTEKATTTPTLSRSSGQSVGAEKIEQKNEEIKKNDQSKEIEKLKKEVEALKQKQSQFKIIEKITEKPIIAEKKESSSSQTKQNENMVTLPNGAVVEMDAKGNVVRTIKEAPQQIYVAPTAQTQQTSTPSPTASYAPTSRILEASLQSNVPEIHSKTGATVVRAALFPFTLKASGNADTHISKIKFRTLGPTRFTDMWIEADDGTYVGNKVDASSVFSGGYGYIPVSITMTPGKTSNFTLYVNVPARVAKSSGVEHLYMEGITSDAGSMSDFPLSGNASLWYDRAPAQITVQSQVCNLATTNLKTDYVLADLLQNGNTDGRIFMNAYILDAADRNYYDSNPPATMTITTSNHTNDKTISGSGNTGPCGYYYPYEFYVTEKGIYTITYSALGLSKSVTITVK